MTLIEPKVELIEEFNPLKKIEIAGRTCYKSEANITNESAQKFFNRLAKNGHMAMLEHATFIFEVFREDIYLLCKTNKYINCSEVHMMEISIDGKNTVEYTRYLVSGNLRAIVESDNMYLISALYKYNPEVVLFNEYSHNCIIEDISDKDIKVLENLNELEYLHSTELEQHLYTTMRFTCDRGVTHEIVRHRPFSFAQESTRYVNYTKEQNGNGDIKFIRPADFDNWSESLKSVFISSLERAEDSYNMMIANGAVAQEARAVIPNAVKTEIIITGNHKEWKHFFDLRSFGTTGKPHPDMKKVADIALEIYPVDFNEDNWSFK